MQAAPKQPIAKIGTEKVVEAKNAQFGTSRTSNLSNRHFRPLGCLDRPDEPLAPDVGRFVDNDAENAT